MRLYLLAQHSDQLSLAKILKERKSLRRPLTASIVRLGLDLGLDLVAEGIETPEQLAVVAEMGCRYGQGYLYSRPVAETDFRELLANERAASSSTTGRTSL